MLRLHLAGDQDAFGTLFLRHKDRLWAVALRIVCDPDDAADALQEAMISAFRRAENFRGDSAVTTWLHRIAVNASLDLLRRKASRRSVSWSGDPDEIITPKSSTCTLSATPNTNGTLCSTSTIAMSSWRTRRSISRNSPSSAPTAKST